jgi:HK97 family phage portal protein
MIIKLPIIGQVKTGSDADIKTISAPESKEKLLDIFGGMLDFSSQRLSGETSISTKLLGANKEWVYRNNDVIAQEVSKIDFELYTIGLSGGEIVYNPIETHPLLDLLDKPNAETTGSDIIYTTQSHKKLAGDAFWLKVRNGGQVIAVRQLPPDKVILNLKNPTPEEPTTISSYTYKDIINGEKIVMTYAPEDIIHFKKPNPNNPFRGIGAVESLAETIDLDNLTNLTSKKFFQNGAITNFVLSTDAKIGDDQLTRLKAELKSNYGGANNAFKAMILGGGLKPENISYTNQQIQFMEQLAWYRDKIMVGFGNTKASLGLIDDVNRASHQSSMVSWLRGTVKPDAEAIVNTLNEYLVPEFGTNLVLGFCDPVPQDRTNDIQEAKDLYPIGVVTRNEAREMLDLESVEGGDEFADLSQATINPDDEAVDQEVEGDA